MHQQDNLLLLSGCVCSSWAPSICPVKTVHGDSVPVVCKKSIAFEPSRCHNRQCDHSFGPAKVQAYLGILDLTAVTISPVSGSTSSTSLTAVFWQHTHVCLTVKRSLASREVWACRACSTDRVNWTRTGRKGRVRSICKPVWHSEMCACMANQHRSISFPDQHLELCRPGMQLSSLSCIFTCHLDSLLHEQHVHISQRYVKHVRSRAIDGPRHSAHAGRLQQIKAGTIQNCHIVSSRDGSGCWAM